jgi:D-xylose transport system permease protein
VAGGRSIPIQVCPKLNLRKAVIAVLMFWFPIQDLTLSALYGATGLHDVALLAHIRDVVVLVISILAFTRLRMPRGLYISILLYGLFVFAGIPIGASNGASAGVIITSAAVLLLPPMLVLVGYWGHRSLSDFNRSLDILIFLAVVSAAFGCWEIQNTSFWTNTVSFPKYMMDIKNVIVLDPSSLLPMNFFHGGEDGMVRRAAGILAAPLAQGSFLATMGLLAVARFYKPSQLLIGLAILGFCAFGVVQSDTRGAMIYLAVAIGVYIIFLADTPKKFGLAIAGATVAMLLFVVFEWQMLVLALTLGDVSSLGHAQALLTNVMNIRSVLFIGNGVGLAGAYASLVSGVSSFYGYGGESAIFSVAYQLGVPGAIVFLLFFFLLLRWLLRTRKTLPPRQAHIATALLALGIGSVTTFISSEHIFTFSGFGQYWLLVGGVLGVATRRQGMQKKVALPQSAEIVAAPAQ